jgi:hypothetical protein
MSRTFVAIDDSVHRLLRNLTHRTPLVATVDANEAIIMAYQINETTLPNSYYALALFHSIGGMPLEHIFQSRWKFSPAERSGVPPRVGYFDITRLDRRCLRDIRLRASHHDPAMLSAELLAFGTGTLRARNNDPEDPLQRDFWSRHGRFHTQLESVHATIGVLHRRKVSQKEPIGKESYDSTNLIYGDVLGELEQLWDRRADTEFLQQVANSLRGLKQRGRIVCHRDPPLNTSAAVELHISRGGIWKRPPETARALLGRIEFILSCTAVDSWPTNNFRYRQPTPESDRGSERG